MEKIISIWSRFYLSPYHNIRDVAKALGQSLSGWNFKAIAKALKDCQRKTPQEILDIQKTCGKNDKCFAGAWMRFEHADCIDLANALSQSPDGFNFSLISGALKACQKTPEEILDIQKACGKNDGYFANAWVLFEDAGCMDLANTLSQSPHGGCFIEIAIILKDLYKTPGKILEIQKACGKNCGYFTRAWDLFKNTNPLDVADSLNRTPNAEYFCALANKLKDSEKSARNVKHSAFRK